MSTSTLQSLPAVTGAARKKRRKGGVASTLLMAVVAIFWISPLVFLVITAIRPLTDFMSNGAVSWPAELTWANFSDAWRIGNFATTYRNNFILMLLKVPLGVFISALLAYALAKLRMRFGGAVMYLVFCGLTIPIYIAIVPLFLMMRSIGATDSLFGLIGPYLAFGIPFEVLVLQSFFRQVPDELLEAARMEGAGEYRIFFRIVLPLSLPALVTVFILDAVSTWNEFLMALILLNSDENKTIPVGLLSFQGQFSQNTTGLAAGIIIAVLPILFAYMLLQKWIVGGLTVGATKG